MEIFIASIQSGLHRQLNVKNIVVKLVALTAIGIVFSLIDTLIIKLIACSVCRCLLDTACHAFIGGVLWVSIIWQDNNFSNIIQFSGLCSNFNVEILHAMICGSLIDLDHFISAGSLSLYAATHLTQRPFAHTLLFCCAFPLLLCLLFRTERRASLMVFTAFLSHLLRDSVRRGLWLWPCGSTTALSLTSVLALYSALSVIGSALLLAWKPAKLDHQQVESLLLTDSNRIIYAV